MRGSRSPEGDEVIGATPKGMISTTNRVASLDGLRGIACLLVLVGHFNSPENWSLYAAQRFVIVHFSASQAVMLFFSLSAFLLTYLASAELDRRKEFSPKRFIIRRAFRIWPLVYCAIVFELLVVIPPWGLFPLNDPSRVQWIWSHAWMYLTFVSNWSIATNFLWHLDLSTPALAVLWTVALEEQFYLVFPFVFLLIVRASAHKKLAIASAIFVFSILWKIGLWLIALLYLKNTNRAVDPIYYSTFSYVDILVAAAAAGWIAASVGSYQKLKAFLKTPLAGVLVVGLLVASIMAWKFGYHYPWTHKTVLLPLSIPVIAIAFSVTILWLFLNSGSAAARVLADSRLRTIGILSFGIYIWHSTAGAVMNRLIDSSYSTPGAVFDTLWILRFFSFFFYSLVLSLLSYRFIERPALDLRVRWYSDVQTRGFPFNYNRWLVMAFAVAAVLTIAARLLYYIY
jgi:peptidoglycan/LPS O-acetylase OafA/YrhL